MTFLLKTRILSVLLLGLLFALGGCKEEGCTDPAALNYNPEAQVSSDDCSYPNLMFHLHQKVGTEDLSLNTDYTLNGTKVRFETVNFYLDEISLMDDDGNEESLDATLLVEAGKMMYDLGRISKGHKHMLMFKVGVDSATNHLTDPTTLASDDPLAPKVPSMHWSWDKGYIFLRIDGQVDTDGDGSLDQAMEFHIGKVSNLAQVMLTAHSDADVEDFEIGLEFDVAALFAGIDLKTENVTHTGDNPALATKVAANLPAAFSLEE
jgi:hypothetical protein